MPVQYVNRGAAMWIEDTTYFPVVLLQQYNIVAFLDAACFMFKITRVILLLRISGDHMQAADLTREALPVAQSIPDLLQ